MTDALLPDMLSARAAEAAQGTALVVDGVGQLTFGDWHARANSVAHVLRERGVVPGERVALVVSDHDWLDYAACFFGILRAGAVALPLSARLTVTELETATRLARCVAALLGADVPDAVVPGWSVRARDLCDGAGATEPPRAVAPDGVAQLLYTAGTTGTPKLVAASHANVLAGWSPGRGQAHAEGRHFVHATPVACNAGQVTMLHPLHEPHTAVVQPGFEPMGYTRLIQRYGADHTMLVPATASWLVESGVGGADLSSVRSVALTAAPATPTLLAAVDRAFPEARVTNCYTSTEAWPAMTAMDYDPSRPTSLGRPLDGQRVEVLDADGRLLPPGVTGEIALATTRVPARCYVDTGGTADTADPSGTDTGGGRRGGEVFADGRVRTGDLGYLDTDGYLYLVDRRTDLIVTGGSNVSCLEVEGALAEHPAVAEAAVTGLEHPTLGTMVGAAVVTRWTVEPAEVREFLRGRVADYKLPAVLVPVERLPRNELGKVLRPQVGRLLRAGLSSARGTPVAPRSQDELVLLRAWCEVLGRFDLGVEDDFIAVGGHSLAAFRIADLVSAALDVSLPRSLLLTSPTVAAQAAAVAALRRDGGAAAIAPIRRRRRPGVSRDGGSTSV